MQVLNEQVTKKLRELKQRVLVPKKQRTKKKLKLEKAGQIDSSLIPKKPGRPRLTAEQNGLLEAIVAVATADNNKFAADPRRRSEEIRSYMTLDHLVSELQARGFQIKRSAVHLKLLPKRSSSIEGKRHIETVPVRICKPPNDLYDRHQNADFCFSIVKILNYWHLCLVPKNVSS